MTTIPNELKITINTSIPGFQKVTYTPNMTIPDISKDENTIQFNPLVKLDQSIINKVPEKLRKKEFFNKGLFQSLINFNHPKPVKSLAYATDSGIVDSNIKTTLNTLFPENSVIYINKTPYTIADVQWSKGNWKIDTKYKPVEIDISKVSDPHLYKRMVQEKIKSGEQQLDSLPEVVVYGSGYNGVKNAVASGIQPRPTTTQPITTQQEQPQRQMPAIMPPEPPPRQIPAIMPPDTSPSVSAVTTTSPSPPASLQFSPQSSKSLRNYLKNQKFYYCLNAIFNKFSDRQKEIMNNNLLHTTKKGIVKNGLNLSKIAYNESVDSISVNKEPTDGSCFFSAVAEAINYHNYTTETDKITNGNYGNGTKIFTQSYLRKLVLKYLLSQSNLESYKQVALSNVDELNTTFENTVKELQTSTGEALTTEKYVETANDIRKNSDNFLVNSVKSVPINVDDYFKPFTVMNIDEIKTYIMSNDYWANEIAIYALCNELGLNIIPIHKVDKSTDKYMLKIPFGNFSKNVNNNWSRYLFLYWSGGHYELLSFNFIERKLIKKFNSPQSISYSTTKKTIFKRNDMTKIAPLSILFLIFGEYYYSQTDEVKDNFSFFPQVMSLFENKFNEALEDPTIKDVLSENFTNFFENTTNLPLTTGGYNPNYNQARYNPNYNPAMYNPNYNPARYNPNYNPAMYNPNYNPAMYNPNYNPAMYNPNYNPPRYNPNYNPAMYNPNYNPSRYNPNYNPYYNQRLPIKRKENTDNTNISYYITIDMELYPGTSIPPEDLSNLRCIQKWNSVRKAYADFTGKPYVITPVYNLLKYNKNNKSKNNKINNKNPYGNARTKKRYT